jgi:hypothetical protein
MREIIEIFKNHKIFDLKGYVLNEVSCNKKLNVNYSIRRTETITTEKIEKIQKCKLNTNWNTFMQYKYKNELMNIHFNPKETTNYLMQYNCLLYERIKEKKRNTIE